MAHNTFVSMSAEEAEAMKREGKGLDGTPAPAAPSPHEQEATARATAMTLAEKMEEARTVLASKRVADDGRRIDECAHVVSLIDAIAGTLAKLDALDPAIAATARATAMTLAEKMEEARTVLASKRVADDGRRIDECAHVVSLIDAIAGTLAKLEPICRT